MKTTGRAVTLVAACVAALVVAPSAEAASTKVVAMRFPFADPGDARLGDRAAVQGAVRSIEPGVVDFRGPAVISLPDRGRLDPGTGDFSVGLRMRLTRGAGDWNIVQKGFWSDPGQWKLSLDNRADGLRLSCRMKGTSGAVMAYSRVGAIRTGDAWAVVVCARVGGRITISVDGEVVGTAAGTIGSVANARRVLIGSKGMSASDPDQFLGQIDWLWIRS